MEGEQNQAMLAPPAVSHLRAEAGMMERSLSADIREEREDLRQAAEETLNVIMDLSMDGTINWVSPSWSDVIGTTLDSVQNMFLPKLLDLKFVLIDGSSGDFSALNVISPHPIISCLDLAMMG
ncbi:hypothetical protein PX690_21550 [Bacillus velezensis]|uniref:hypothetical protein n=1 Tax=Bacillus velezensis TaxID=492670 RepID=UPI0023E0B436|nr:hypothetical protein [Bacillus velezensis]WES02054.1 hypothetical protein PX690_21550 [Bacillus velezensis]